MCLESNNSVFNNKYFFQTDGTAQGPHMSCSCSNIAIESLIKKHYSITTQLQARIDFEIMYSHSREDLDLFFNYMINIDSTKKIQFIMEVAKDVLEFLDLQLKLDKVSKLISVDIFSKATNHICTS